MIRSTVFVSIKFISLESLLNTFTYVSLSESDLNSSKFIIILLTCSKNRRNDSPLLIFFKTLLYRDSLCWLDTFTIILDKASLKISFIFSLPNDLIFADIIANSYCTFLLNQ